MLDAEPKPTYVAVKASVSPLAVTIVAVVPLIDKSPLETIIFVIGRPIGLPSTSVTVRGGTTGPLIFSPYHLVIIRLPYFNSIIRCAT